MSNAFAKYDIEYRRKDFSTFEKNDMEKILTFHVGKIVPRILKELDIYIDKENQMTARQTSLIVKGKNDKRETHNMKSYTKEYFEFYEEINVDILKTIEDILEEIIKDMTLYNKNKIRKDKFFKTLENVEGQTFIFVIAIICIGEHMINKYGRILNGRYLENVLIAKKLLSNEIKSIYKQKNRGEITEEEANNFFRNLIENKIQTKTKFDSELYNEIKFEEDLYNICSQESLKKFIYNQVENVRIKITKAPRLISLLEI